MTSRCLRFCVTETLNQPQCSPCLTRLALALTPTCTVLYAYIRLLQVPLLLETIPTPAEFRDAIESLS